MSSHMTVYNVAVDAGQTVRHRRRGWVALSCRPEQVQISGRHADAAAASASVPGAALAVVRGRVDDSCQVLPDRSRCAATARLAARRTARPQPGTWQGSTRAGHVRTAASAAAWPLWSADSPSSDGRCRSGWSAPPSSPGSPPSNVLTYLDQLDWLGWPSTLEDVLAETTLLQLSPQDVLACLAFGLHETDAG